MTIDDVIHSITTLSTRKDPGPMGIPAAFLQSNSETLAQPITAAINIILQGGSIPLSWKNSFLAPIPKKGQRTAISNYRGIALQSIMLKIIDRHVTHLIIERMDDIIPHQQHGFRKGKSTTTNLLTFSNFVDTQLAAGLQVDAIYVDFSKAFDTVSHRSIAKKLASLNAAFALLDHDVAGDPSAVYFEIFPEAAFVTGSSVPQGSHCGPILFAIYTSDLQLTNGKKFLQYADDLKIYRSIVAHRYHLTPTLSS